METKNKKKLTKDIVRALVEIGFIIFLFYSNLLMGEYDKTGNGEKRGYLWALGNIFTVRNFEIAIVAATIGFIAFEFIRRKI